MDIFGMAIKPSHRMQPHHVILSACYTVLEYLVSYVYAGILNDLLRMQVTKDQILSESAGVSDTTVPQFRSTVPYHRKIGIQFNNPATI